MAKIPGIGGNSSLDPSIMNSDPAIGSSANSIANGIQQSTPAGISSAVSAFENASAGNQLNFEGQVQGSLAPEATILPPGTFFSSVQNLSTFDAQVANILQDPNFDPNQGMQDLNTKIQNGELDPGTPPSGVIEDADLVKSESQIFQTLASAVSEVMKNFGGALQSAARG